MFSGHVTFYHKEMQSGKNGWADDNVINLKDDNLQKLQGLFS
jgi:hypothetical protein